LDAETSLWYDRFHTYLLLGPNRSVLQTMKDLGVNSINAQQWYQMARIHNWKKRAEEWDSLNQRRERELIEQARKKSKEDRIALLDKVRGRFDASLTDLDQDELEWKTVAPLIRAIVSELRTEYEGDKQPAQNGFEVEAHLDAQNVLKMKIMALKDQSELQVPEEDANVDSIE
jgi:hypothetical protein